MKFVIKGRTFDTATATKLAIARGIIDPSYNNLPGDAEIRYEDTLYRTAKGTLFLHEHNTTKYMKGGKPLVTDDAKEMTPESAVAWIGEWRAMVFDATGLPLPDEA